MERSIGSFCGLFFMAVALVSFSTVSAEPLASATTIQNVEASPPQVTLGNDGDTVTVRESYGLFINLTNPNAQPATLVSDFTIQLPPNFIVFNGGPGGQYFTNCGNDALRAPDGAVSVTLFAGAIIPANSYCLIQFYTVGTQAGMYTTTIPAGALQTDRGANAVSVSTQVTVTGVALSASIQLSSAKIQPGQSSLLTVTFSNPNATPATLLSNTDVLLPPNLEFADQGTTTCVNGVADALSSFLFNALQIEGPAIIPANGQCSFSASVTAGIDGDYSISFSPARLITDVAGVTGGGTVSLQVGTIAPGYVATVPSRVLDTRAGGVTVDDQFAGGGALAAGAKLDLNVLGRGAVPSAGVAAVALNLTVTNPTASGFITAWPSSPYYSMPLSSNLNFVPGLTIPNLVIVPVGSNGAVSLFNSAGNTDVVADVVGYVLAGSALMVENRTERFLDTRIGGQTIDGKFAGIGPVAGGNQIDLGIQNRALDFFTGLNAIVLNVTVTNPTMPGFVTAFASGTPRPLSSNLNFVPGQTIANLVVAPVGSDGKVSLYNSAGSVDLIADVIGWAPPNSQLHTVTSARLMDSRSGMSTIDGLFLGSGAVSAGAHVDLAVSGRGGIPSGGIEAVILNVTATNPTVAGYVTVWPTGTSQPLASNLNFTAGITVPNLVIAPLGSNGAVSLFNSAGTTDLVVDVVGWLSTNPDL